MVLVIKHAEDEGPGLFGEYLKRGGHNVRTTGLHNGDPLPRIEDCAAIISMGGPMNVYEEDKYPFLAHETTFLKMALQNNMPILGICLGAQLLAKAAGSHVSKAPSAELGWQKISLSAEGKSDPLFKHLPGDIEVFQWHEDTFDIPREGVLLATSAACRHQAMRIGKRAWGLQFHPEVTRQMLDDWAGHLSGKIGKEELVKGYLAIEANYRLHAELIYKNFCKSMPNYWANKA